MATRATSSVRGRLFDDGVEQCLEIGFRTEAAAKLDEGLAVVVAVTVEGAVDPALNAALEWIEDGRGHRMAMSKAHSRTASGRRVVRNQL